nr:hypothetical protein [Saccharothrix longispora]
MVIPLSSSCSNRNWLRSSSSGTPPRKAIPLFTTVTRVCAGVTTRTWSNTPNRFR